jgi:hypothetical protein
MAPRATPRAVLLLHQPNSRKRTAPMKNPRILRSHMSVSSIGAKKIELPPAPSDNAWAQTVLPRLRWARPRGRDGETKHGRDGEAEVGTEKTARWRWARRRRMPRRRRCGCGGAEAVPARAWGAGQWGVPARARAAWLVMALGSGYAWRHGDGAEAMQDGMSCGWGWEEREDVVRLEKG